MFYDDDLAKNKTMSKKNFASRVYHKVDKIGSRVQARAAVGLTWGSWLVAYSWEVACHQFPSMGYRKLSIQI